MLTLDDANARLNMEIDLIPAGSSNRPGGSIRPTFITIHNTSNASAGADARMHSQYVKGADARARKVSWHFTVDDTRCIKHLPTTEIGWHAGGGNSRSIGIEICENSDINQEAVLDRAALLTALMMRSLGITTTEKIVPHQFWTGKDCPHVVLRLPGGFDGFRQRAKQYLDELSAPGGMLAGVDAGLGVPGTDLGTLGELSDQLEAMDADAGAGVATTASTTADDIADLQRIIGQLTLENYRLKKAIESAQDSLNETA